MGFFSLLSHVCFFFTQVHLQITCQSKDTFFFLSIEGHIFLFFSAYADSLPAFTGMMCFAHLTYHGSPSPPGSHRGWDGSWRRHHITHRIRMPLPSAGWVLPCRRRRPCRSMTSIYTAGYYLLLCYLLLCLLTSSMEVRRIYIYIYIYIYI